MSWNYRLCKQTYGDEVLYGIHEVYYNKSGKITAVTLNPVTFTAETSEEVRTSIERAAIAFNRDVVDLDTIEYAPEE